ECSSLSKANRKVPDNSLAYENLLAFLVFGDRNAVQYQRQIERYYYLTTCLISRVSLKWTSWKEVLSKFHSLLSQKHIKMVNFKDLMNLQVPDQKRRYGYHFVEIVGKIFKFHVMTYIGLYCATFLLMGY
ncbi:hypothetical protein MTR67_012458, partial [Solanum verrucosum]